MKSRVVAEPRKLPIKPIIRQPMQILRVFFVVIGIWVDELVTPWSRSLSRRIVSMVIDMRDRVYRRRIIMSRGSHFVT